MQGCADGYFVLPATIPDYLANARPVRVDVTHPAFQEAKETVIERRTSACCRCAANGLSSPCIASWGS